MNRRSFVAGLGAGALVGVPVVGSPVGDRLAERFVGSYRVSTAVEHSADVPVVLEATVHDGQVSAGNPAEIEFSVRNVSDESIVFETPIPLPFGVLEAGESGPLLWTSAYREESGVQIEWGGLRIAIAEVAMTRDLSPGQVVSERYELRATDPMLRSGRFEVTASNSGFPGQYGSEITAELDIDSA